MLHYAVNRPLGALMGESDLTTMIPWLLRYSRMMEDRVRLHWAVRAFLWVITVPGNRVREKQEQYRNPPEAGSIIVKDESERWEVHAPNLNAGDARHDLQAVRAMIDAGSGYPPHWRGDAGDISLATAQAMQNPTERHLLRRQRHFIYILQDILYHAYRRAVEIGAARPLLAQPLPTHRVLDLTRLHRQLGHRDVVPAREAVRRTARWYAENPLEYGGIEEKILTDPFDYAAEDALMDSWLAARASVKIPQFRLQPKWGMAYSGPQGRARTQKEFVE